MSCFVDILELSNQIDTYDPNGISKFTYAQTNETVTYSHDLDGRLTSILDPALQRSISYDTGNRITNITDGKAQFTGNYVHDRLDRLTTQNLGQTNLVYAYDANSNRTQKTNNGTVTATPIQPTSNKLTNVTYDASGRITNDGTRSYSYNTEGRLQNVSKDNKQANYKYNALSQRVKKQVRNDTTYFSYDEQGKLVGEYDKDGKLIREYIYLNNIPVGMFTAQKQGELLQIHTDHLGTPRAVTDKTQKVLWRWEGDQFGDVQPQVKTITLPLRHAGQYADDETGLFYNYHRYYDPSMGRYISSDPIGLAGGLNTFGYVGGSPLNWTDPMGLCPLCAKVALDLAIQNQGAVDATVGFGDGILGTLSFGLINGQDIREISGIDGGVNQCSYSYAGGRVAGTTLTLLANAYGAIPKTLTHFTTAQGAKGIASSGGVINPSSRGLFGGGTYASSVGRYPRNPLVPPKANVPITINNTGGYIRTLAPGTYINPTAGGTLLMWNISYGAFVNRDLLQKEDEQCECAK